MATICIVEDDEVLRTELARLLQLADHTPLACTDYAGAVAWGLDRGAELFVLDLTLPGTDGHTLCRELRRASKVPALVLTSSDSEFDEVMAMKIGADGYLQKPYRPAVLLAHIEALLRKAAEIAGISSAGSPGTPSRRIEHGGVALDLGSGTVLYRGASAELTRNEQRILSLLLENPGTIVTRQELMCELWDSDEFVDDNTLTVNVNRLRKVLAGLGVPDGFLATKRGQGYLV